MTATVERRESGARLATSDSGVTAYKDAASGENRRVVLEFSSEKVEQIDSMKAKLQLATRKEMFNYAIGLLDWAIRQREKGYVIMVGDHERERYIQLSMPALDSIEKTDTDQGM